MGKPLQPVGWLAQTRTESTAIDDDIVRAALADPILFYPLYERYADSLWWFASTRLRSADAADDVVSETMLAALEELDRFNPNRGSFKGWLFAIARHKVNDHFRVHNRFWRAVRRHSTIALVEHEQNLLEQVMNQEEIASLHQALAELSQQDQEILALRYSAELTSQQTGEALGISDSAAGQRLTRARQRLRSVMSRQEE